MQDNSERNRWLVMGEPAPHPKVSSNRDLCSRPQLQHTSSGRHTSFDTDLYRRTLLHRRPRQAFATRAPGRTLDMHCRASVDLADRPTKRVSSSLAVACFWDHQSAEAQPPVANGVALPRQSFWRAYLADHELSLRIGTLVLALCD